ncbi:MAG: hypothetical protein ACPGNV_12640 [Mangrovicoccus sp.]
MTIPDNPTFALLADHGVEYLPPPKPAPLDSFQVFGERCSGTSYVERLIAKNTPLSATRRYGWKHGFPTMLAIPSSVLVVGVVRHAIDWTLSLYSRPWHSKKQLQKQDYSGFIRTPWHSYVDRMDYFHGSSADDLGQPLLLDRHPITGTAFANILDMRQAKLASLLAWRRRGVALMLVRYELVRDDPWAVLHGMKQCFNLAGARSIFRPVRKRLGTKFHPLISQRAPRPNYPNQDDLTYILSRLDHTQEASCGYFYAHPKTN